ncbi:MAG: 4Fe-4S binding protein [Clostridiales bacterium]
MKIIILSFLIFLSQLETIKQLKKSTLLNSIIDKLNYEDSKYYILVSILTLSSILIFIRFWSKIRLLFLIFSLIIFGFFYSYYPNFLDTYQDLSLFALTNKLPELKILIVFLIPIAFSLLFGRVFCGSACPLGAIQEIIGKIGHAAYLKNLKYPIQIKYLKYLNIILFAGITYVIGNKWFIKFDPFLTLFNFDGTKLSIFILGLILSLSFAFSRPFCKYLCPYGAFLGLIAKISFFKPKLAKSCKNCGICTDVCPMNCVEMGKINHIECIRCGKCKSACPVGRKVKPKDIERSFKTNNYNSRLDINYSKNKKRNGQNNNTFFSTKKH